MPYLFISYTQDSDARKAEVKALAEALRREGITVSLDQDHPPSGPRDGGWPVWSGREAETAEFVLIIASRDYLDCWHGRKPPGIKNGATHEAITLQNRVYLGGAGTDFLRVAWFSPGDKAFIPARLAGLTHFSAHQPESIVAWLTGGPVAPSLPMALPVSSVVPVTSSIPFDYQHPALPPGFVGRQSLLCRIETLLASGGGMSLVGDSRMGKSSLLATARQQALAAGHAVGFADSQQTALTWPALVGALTAGQVQPSAAQCADADAAADLIGDWARAQPRRPLLLMDEGEGFIREVEIRFFERLRGLLQSAVLGLVFATRSDLPSLFRKHRQTTSPFGNTLATEPLGLLDEASAQQLAERAGPHSGLLRLWAGAHPYYLQLLGAVLAAEPEVPLALRTFRNTARDCLARQWDLLLPGEQRGLEAAAAGMAVNEHLLPGLQDRGLLTAEAQPFGRVLSDWLKTRAARLG